MRKKFRPSTRGSLTAIADKPSKFDNLAHESPRPAELLMGIRAENGIALSALDISVWELILSWTYEVDPKMAARAYKMPTAALRRFLGEFVKRDEVIRSFNKISGVKLTFGTSVRCYSGVSMLTTWREATKDDEFVAWQFPEPLRLLMSDMRRYAHIELSAVVGKKSSRYSTAIYKYLALEASKHRWEPGARNMITVSVSPDELADIVDFPRDASGRYNIGKLSAVVVGHEDDYEIVRRFKAVGRPVYAARRGRPVERYEFEIQLCPPSPQHIAVSYSPKHFRAMALGGIDDERYRVRSDLWLRAFRAFKDYFPGYLHKDFYEFWKIALSEALSRKPLSAGYGKRKYRGDSLLDQIGSEGADYAAWGLITEEAENPDLFVYLKNNVTRKTQLAVLGEFDRRDRVGWQTSKLRESAKRYFDRARQNQPLEAAPEIEMILPQTADDFDYASYFDEAGGDPDIPSDHRVSFDNAVEITLTFKPANIEQLEEDAFSFLRDGDDEEGGRSINVICAYEDRESQESGFYEKRVKLNFEEWCKLLAQLQPFLVGQEMYA